MDKNGGKNANRHPTAQGCHKPSVHKKTTPAKCNKAKHNKTRCACKKQMFD